jgi:predicted nucleic acid-binding Zn ribbon protein
MGINIYCGECGKEIEAEDIVCTECYETLKEDLDALQQTVDEQGGRIKKLED